MPPRDMGRGRLQAEKVGDFVAYCRATRVRPTLQQCEFFTTEAAELVEHMRHEHDVVPLKPQRLTKTKPPSKYRGSDFAFVAKPWEPGDTVTVTLPGGVEFEAQVWSTAPGNSMRWVVLTATGDVWLAKKGRWHGHAISPWPPKESS